MTEAGLQVDILDFEEIHGEDGKVFVMYRLRLAYVEKTRSLNKHWEIKRRFSEFYELYLKLMKMKQYDEVYLNFPNRLSMTFSRKSIAERRVPVLNQYIKDIISFGPTYDINIVEFLKLASVVNDDIAKAEFFGTGMRQTFSDASTGGAVAPGGSGIDGCGISGVSSSSSSKWEATGDPSSSTPSSPRSPRPGLLKKEKSIFDSVTKSLSQTADKVAASLSIKPVKPKKKSIFTFDEIEYDDGEKKDISRNFVHTFFLIAAMSTSFIGFRLAIGFFDRLTNLWSHSTSLSGACFDMLVALFDFVCMFRYTLEVFIGTTIFYMTVHRLLGYLVTRYLRHLLMMENGGYNMSVEWISLRLGLDRNEIIIHNFTWHNPSLFKETEYFCRVGELCISFDFESLYNAITKAGGKSISLNEKNPIKIHHIQLNHATVYMERVDPSVYVHGLNLWAALGADNTQASKEEVEGSVMASLSSAFDGAASVASAAGNAILKYNPAALLYKGAQIAAEALKVALDSDEECDEERLSGGGGDALQKLRNDKKQQVVNGGGDDDEDDDINKEWHWYIDYIFEVNRVTVYDLKVYAQDFINAEHALDFKSNFINIENLVMNREELTKPPKRTTKRRGLYLDVMVWRLINKALTKLFATNQLSLMATVSTGFVNQTSSTISNAFTFGSSKRKHT